MKTSLLDPSVSLLEEVTKGGLLSWKMRFASAKSSMLEHDSLIYGNAKRCHGQAGSSARALIDGTMEAQRQPAPEAGRQMEKKKWENK